MTPEPHPQQGISLQELTEAFAQAMGYTAQPDAKREEGPEETVPAERAGMSAAESEAQGPESETTPAAADDPCPITPQTILEAMLFVGNQDNQPLTPQRAAELMRGVEPGEIAGLVDSLNRRYTATGCPYHILSEGAGYRLTLRRAFGSLRSRFYGRIREARLSQAAVDVLAIVAYRQPVTAEDVRQLRGKPSNRLLAHLVRRGLLRVDRPDQRTRTAHYYTAHRFLELFGLRSLEDLPQSEDLDRQ